MSNIINYLEYKNATREQHEVYMGVIEKLLLTNVWEDLVTSREYEIIQQHISHDFVPDLKNLGQLVDVVEIKRAGRANGYIPVDDDSRYENIFNNLHTIVEGKQAEDDTRNRVYACFYEHGLLVVSDNTYYTTLYDNWIHISSSGEIVVIMVYPETVEHKQDMDNNVADPHQYSMASPVVLAILQLFTEWMKNVGHPIVLDFENKQ